MKSALMALVLSTLAGAGMAETPERVQVTGEAIDTWCYYSGVMGGADAVQGSAHHTCALWCAAGGVPVGLLAEDGTVYMVMKLPGEDASNGGDTLLSVASHRLSVDGLLYRRDGINYLVVEKVVADEGITSLTHSDYGVVPDFAIPEPKQE